MVFNKFYPPDKDNFKEDGSNNLKDTSAIIDHTLMFVKIFLNEFDYDQIEEESFYNPNAMKLKSPLSEYDEKNYIII